MFVSDALSVPIRSNSCDACISIAVIHHMSTLVSMVSTTDYGALASINICFQMLEHVAFNAFEKEK